MIVLVDVLSPTETQDPFPQVAFVCQLRGIGLPNGIWSRGKGTLSIRFELPRDSLRIVRGSEVAVQNSATEVNFLARPS